jgi:hypothetical protein
MTPSRFNQLNQQPAPKLVNFTKLWIIAIIGASIASGFAGFAGAKLTGTRIDLPEEYRLIKPTDNLRGEWKDGVLYLEFAPPPLCPPCNDTL